MNEMVQQEDISSAAVAAQPQPKAMTQEEINALVAARHNAGYEKGRREAMGSMPQNQGLSEEQHRQIVKQEVERAQFEQMQQANAQRIVGEFANKIAAAQDKYPDFDKKLAEFDLGSMPEIVALANSVDNTADVMHEIVNNPYKAVTLVSAMRNKMPHIAQQELTKLSRSIADNQKAAQNVLPKEPLKQVTPSTAGGDDGAPKSIADFKRASWLRR